MQRTCFPAVRNAELVPRAVAIDAFIEVGALHFDPAAARRRIRAAAPRRPIVSLETLSGYLHNGGLAGALSKDLAHRLYATLPDADVVVFIRRQQDVLAASYAQYVRYGGSHSLERYLFPRNYKSLKHTRRDKNPRFEMDHFAYLPLLRLYRELFGKNRVHVYLFEVFRSDRYAFVRDFSTRFNLDCGTVPETGAPHNRSLSPQALAVVRWINLFTAGRVLDKSHILHIPGMFWVGRGIGRGLSRLLPARGGSDLSRLASDDLVQRVRDYYSESNRYLAAEFDLPLAEHGYPVQGGEPSTRPEEADTATYRAAS